MPSFADIINFFLKAYVQKKDTGQQGEKEKYKTGNPKDYSTSHVLRIMYLRESIYGKIQFQQFRKDLHEFRDIQVLLIVIDDCWYSQVAIEATT